MCIKHLHRSSNHNHRYFEAMPDWFDGAAENNVSEAPMTVATHDKDVYVLLVHQADNLFCHVSEPEEGLDLNTSMS
jgi:hypothetical protein